MYIYSPEKANGNRSARFSEFGIEIPLGASTRRRIFEALKADPRLGNRVRDWHIPDTGDRISREEAELTHSSAYLNRFKLASEREKIAVSVYELIDSDGNFNRYNPRKATRPLSELAELSFPYRLETFSGIKAALQHGFAFTGGGAHHAMSGYGRGFCVVNDVVMAPRAAQARGWVENVAIIDADAHKGDGTAVITQNDSSIKTLSIHMAHGWPLDTPEFDEDGKKNLSYTPSDIDIPIESGEEELYNRRLTEGLDWLFGLQCYDIAVVLAGADVWEHDQLPSTSSIGLTLTQIEERNRLIHDYLNKRGVPQVYLTAGGYSNESWRTYLDLLKTCL